MKRIDLVQIQHNIKVGDECPYFEPNVVSDSIFYADGEPIGFYLTKMPEKMCNLADLANFEFMSERVPKQKMLRQTADGIDETTGKYKYKNKVVQMSTILGSIAPKPFQGRNYASRHSTHSSKSAQIFIKAMIALSNESFSLVKEILPKQHETQSEIFSQIKDKWKFGNYFTSSISNFNISVPFHRDTQNIKNTVNVIICKKENAIGGDLHIPDYGATIGQQDNSILVYPAWRNLHGVTPIIPTKEGGYRNSLVFYPLNAFVGLD